MLPKELSLMLIEVLCCWVAGIEFGVIVDLYGTGLPLNE